jgi:ribosomal protein S19
MICDWSKMEQTNMFELLCAVNRPKPKVFVGMRVYQVVLDVIETGVIDHFWEITSKTGDSISYGYSALRDRDDGFRCYMTFWDADIAVTVFAEKKEAEKFAKEQEKKYEVIRKWQMISEEMIGYVQTNHNGTKSSHYLVVLQGNMIYKKISFCYPFLYRFNSQTEMRHALGKMKKEIEKNINGVAERCEVIRVEFEDMYLVRNGNWSSYKYAKDNGAVTK